MKVSVVSMAVVAIVAGFRWTATAAAQSTWWSETDFRICVLDGQEDGAIIACLIGGGQEITLETWFTPVDCAH
ncbi:MAG TPA: hypothetical protein DIT99_31925 [Candidatus Latescibacteria bacterium]|nr:hypothetical protein [Candidatus Latescibacterota bacterium]